MGEKLGNTELFWEDAVVIAVYAVVVLGVGTWSSIRSKGDVSGYFLASRNMHWIPVGASLFASNVGTSNFIGIAGSAAKSGIGVAGVELSAIFVLMLLGWFFIPVYMASGVYTLPEYLRKRFGGQRIRIYLSVLSLLMSVINISVNLFTGALFIKQSMKLDTYSSVLTLLVVAAVFTIAGGLTAVIWTDFLQTIVMLVGGIVLCVLSLAKVGGYHQLIQSFKDVDVNESFVGYNAFNESCSQVPDNYMNLLRSPSDPELPMTGVLIGLTINSVWYWCSNQIIVQRTLAAKNLSHAKGGCILAGYLKILPLFLMVLPGMAARVLFPDEIGCSDPIKCKEICGSELGCTNIAYPKLVIDLMPAGVRGLMLSVMLAALLSSLTSIFNSGTTIFSIDIWRRVRKQASETELVIVGRIFVLLLVAVSVAWIPIVESGQSSQLFHYIQSMISYLAPPLCAVYVLAIFVIRINEQGAFWGLMVGLVVGMIRFILDIAYTAPSCASKLPDPRPDIISKVHYLHFGIILFLLCCLVTVTVSLLTPPIAEKHLYRLRFWNRYSKDVRMEITKKHMFDVLQNGMELRKHVDAKTSSEFNEFKEKFVAKEYQTIFPESRGASSQKENKGIIEKADSPSPWKRILYFMCGISEKQTQVDKESEPVSPKDEAILAAEGIVEKPLWSRICNANALLLLVVGSFIWGYYA